MNPPLAVIVRKYILVERYQHEGPHTKHLVKHSMTNTSCYVIWHMHGLQHSATSVGSRSDQGAIAICMPITTIQLKNPQKTLSGDEK